MGRLKLGLGLACLAALAAGIAVLVVALIPSRSSTSTPSRPAFAVTMSPRTQVFGDPVRARLVVTLDGTADPNTVSLRARFAPYRISRRTREVRGRNVSFMFDLDCLASRCAPLAPERQFRFLPAALHYAGHTYAVVWPPVTVASRLTLADLQHPSFRVDLHHATPQTSSVEPQVLGWSLAGGAALLAVMALGAAFVRRRPELATAAPLRVPEPEPTAVQLAVKEVEEALRRDPGRRRAALDSLATVLEAEGSPDLAQEARTLAWSAETPGGMSVAELLHAVRIGARRAA